MEMKRKWKGITILQRAVLEMAPLCNEWQIETAMLSMHFSVMRVGSDTFGDPTFQKGLQN